MEIAAFVCIGWLISTCFHEFGHAIVAYFGGDTTVKDKGYLTFNIFKYTDPGITFVFPIMILMLGGVALPGAAVYIDGSRLRSRLWMSAVAGAGPIASALVAFAFAYPFTMDATISVPSFIPPALAALVQLQVLSVIFNLLPIPGFDGFGVIEPWLPEPMRTNAIKFGQYAMWIVILILWWMPSVWMAFWSAAHVIANQMGVPSNMMNVGMQAFGKQSGWLVIALILFLFLGRKGKKMPTANECFSNAQQLFKQNRPADAIVALDTALRLKSNWPQAWHLRGLCLGIMGHTAEAIQNFDIALKLEPTYADCLYNKACCYAMQGDAENALSYLNQSVATDQEGIKEHARKDIGFRNLWNDPRFLQLTEIEGTRHA